MELVKPVEPVLWASIVELVIGGTGYGTVEALIQMALPQCNYRVMAHLLQERNMLTSNFKFR